MREKVLVWVSRSKDELLALPKDVRKEFGYALGMAQLGNTHPAAKQMKGELREVLEVRESHADGTYRVMYTVKLDKKVFCLTAFQKKSKKGSETPKPDIERIKSRLKLAKQMHEDEASRDD